jgi:tRNA U55 pseudouridine synthase TruB
MARGRTLMDWSLLSLSAYFRDRFVFACLDVEDGDWIRSMAEDLGIDDVVVAKRSGLSRGQAETAFDALMHVHANEPLWIYNIDTSVRPNAMRPGDLGAAGGCIPVFPCNETNMSFVRYGARNEVIEVAEKKLISNWATVGLYGFSSAERFARYYEATYERTSASNTHAERYVAPMYGLMLAYGELVVAPRLRPDDVHILGTPAQVLAFDPDATPPFGNSAALR